MAAISLVLFIATSVKIKSPKESNRSWKEVDCAGAFLEHKQIITAKKNFQLPFKLIKFFIKDGVGKFEGLFPTPINKVQSKFKVQ